MLHALTLTAQERFRQWYVPVSFDDVFARVVRLSGWALGIWAVVTEQLQGAELVSLVLAFVGFEFVVRFRDRQLERLERRED